MMESPKLICDGFSVYLTDNLGYILVIIASYCNDFADKRGKCNDFVFHGLIHLMVIAVLVLNRMPLNLDSPLVLIC
jgi:hypothetical protein